MVIGDVLPLEQKLPKWRSDCIVEPGREVSHDVPPIPRGDAFLVRFVYDEPWTTKTQSIRRSENVNGSAEPGRR